MNTLQMPIGSRPSRTPRPHASEVRDASPGTDTLLAGWLLAAMLFQELALLHGQYMNKVHFAQFDTFYRGVVLLMPIGIMAMFVFLRHPLAPLPPGGILVAALFCLTTAVSLGLSTQNSLRPKYILADFLRFAPTWFTLFAGYHVFASIHRRQGLPALLKWYDRFAMIAVFDGLITAFFGARFYGYHISNWFYIFLVNWVMLAKQPSDLKMQIILPGVLLTTVLSSKRTNFSLVAFTIGASLVVRLLRGQQISRMIGTLAGMLIVGVVAQSIVAQFTGGDTLWDAFQGVFDNVNEIVVEEHFDDSYLYRINEVENVKSYYREHPLQGMVGIGFGSGIPMLFDTSEASETGFMRHVHKGYWLYFLRHGVVGLLLLGTFMIFCTWLLFQMPTPAPMVTASCAVYCAGRVLASFAGNLMMEDLDLPIAAALGFACTYHASSRQNSVLIDWRK